MPAGIKTLTHDTRCMVALANSLLCISCGDIVHICTAAEVPATLTPAIGGPAALPLQMQAHIVTAPGDGVAPALLLALPAAGAATGSAARLPPAQYLFNVPEGFSRLVLEHKIRPGMHVSTGTAHYALASVCCPSHPACAACAGAGLRAAFACDAHALAGFGGLVMRLRGEGHEQLHVIGPQGALTCEWAAACTAPAHHMPRPQPQQARRRPSAACATSSTGATRW